jgi:hypothetical protein
MGVSTTIVSNDGNDTLQIAIGQIYRYHARYNIAGLTIVKGKKYRAWDWSWYLSGY